MAAVGLCTPGAVSLRGSPVWSRGAPDPPTPPPPSPGFSVEGPSQAKIECDDRGDGSCDVRYWPQEPGAYAVHVLCDNEDIRRSPFMADIRPAPRDSFPEKVGGPPWTPWAPPQRPGDPP